jgi:hypothetical protein
MQAGLVNYADWLTVMMMQAAHPYELVNYAGWPTMHAGQLSRLIMGNGEKCRLEWSTMQAS